MFNEYLFWLLINIWLKGKSIDISPLTVISMVDFLRISQGYIYRHVTINSQTHGRLLKDFCCTMGMIVNTHKTEVMIIKSKKTLTLILCMRIVI